MMMNIATTDVFDRWFAKLRDRQAAARIQVRIDRVEDGHFGDCQPIGEGVHEMRLHFGPGYRLDFMRQRHRWVVLLAGGDKSTQPGDIANAKQIARQLQESQQ